MTPNMKLLLTAIAIAVGLVLLTGCQNTLKILDGATAACGAIHVEGYVTDSQGEVKVMKFPAEWTPEQVLQICP